VALLRLQTHIFEQHGAAPSIAGRVRHRSGVGSLRGASFSAGIGA